MKIKIDTEKCIGCGSCVAVCPDCFEIGDDNKAHLIKEQSSCNEFCAKEAVDICSVDAIEAEMTEKEKIEAEE